MSGTKHDSEKNRLDLIPPAATEGIGLVLTFGAAKYDAYNWTKGIKYSRIIGAIKRHLLAIEKGEDVDPESGLLHADHIACNAAFLQTYQRYDKYKEFDDRHKYEPIKTEPTLFLCGIVTIDCPYSCPHGKPHERTDTCKSEYCITKDRDGVSCREIK